MTDSPFIYPISTAYNFFLRIALSALAALFVHVGVTAQTLDDFRTAAAASKLDVIPFRDMRDKANGLDDAVQAAKAPANQVPEETLLTRQKTNIFGEIKELHDALEAERRIVERYKDDSDDVSDILIKATRETEEQVNSILNGKLKRLNDRITAGAEACGKGAAARAALREYLDIVDKALGEARSNYERYLGSGASEADKSQLYGYIDAIRLKIQAEAVEHSKQESGLKNKSDALTSLASKTQ